MVYSDRLESYIMRIVERTLGNRKSERHGLVTSYDPKTYRAKVRFQPSGQTSGWLPIETGHIGNGYGMAVGLVAGDGQQTGDQVVCRFDFDDFEGGKIVQRVHSDVDKPPMVESGEMVMWTQWGQQIRFNKDGSITFKTAVPTQPDQPAQSTLSSPQYTPTQPPTTQQQQQQSKKQQKAVTVTIDDQGNHTITAQNNITQNATSQINDNAGQSATYSAPTVNTVGETHLGSTGGALLSMSGTVDTAGHADIPPQATKVYAT
jgi:hypothetical protein